MSLVLLALFAALGANAAAPDPVRLEFHRARGAESCPDQESFEASVAARLGRRPWTPDATRVLRISFQPAEGGTGIVATLELLDRGAVLGTRRRRAPVENCTEVAEAFALAAAIVIDPPGARPKP